MQNNLPQSFIEKFQFSIENTNLKTDKLFKYCIENSHSFIMKNKNEIL